ncbi:hypothetical protein ACIP95_30220 [Micromonospora parva]|uniref:Uncharacterized protein n=1 Tax=Micromonospora parva TaxID=1464048 RepID=A0ABW6W1P6_9ACTN
MDDGKLLITRAVDVDPGGGGDDVGVEMGEALRLARSQLWSDRARAGRHLSAVVGRKPVDTVVRSLLLDSANTAVTDATAEELLRRRDAAGLRLIAAAWHVAEPEQGIISPVA